MTLTRRMIIGAEVSAEGADFRVWAPEHKKLELVIGKKGATDSSIVTYELENENNGYFSLFVRHTAAGDRYQFRIDGSERLLPDPASRYQPEGPQGPSELIDPSHYKWNDQQWKGIIPGSEVIYEMHIGTFTDEGTYASAQGHLHGLAELGITVIEIMPLADFPGRFGWGYDGVNLFAPTRLYGTPDQLREFIDTAHSEGIGVILDVVYNHFGPDGNYLNEFSKYYTTKKYKTDWGAAINYDGKESSYVREYMVSNAGYWIEEFHFDGLRLDATQDIHDASEKHILADITKIVREKGKGRRTYNIGENEPQQVKLVKSPDEGGYGLDVLWNDDFHHSAVVALTGKNEAYYTDYLGKPQEFISALKYGYLYQGQYYKWQRKRRGTSALDFKKQYMVNFIENHDQVANSGRGQRIHQLSAPGLYRAMTALMILAPGTPMLFQGQEFVSSKPFNYFADHNKELADKVCRGRVEFLSQFRTIASPEMAACIPDPGNLETFQNCKLDHKEKEIKQNWLLFHKELLALRKNDNAFNSKERKGIDGAVLGDNAFLIRYFMNDGSDRLMIVNLGVDLDFSPAPEPLIAPPQDMNWKLIWTSESPRYGGNGVPEFNKDRTWIIPGHCTVVFIPEAREKSVWNR